MKFRKIAPKESTNICTNENQIIKRKKPSRIYQCEECLRQFTSYRMSVNHHKIHEIENVCRYCREYFVDKQILDAHILKEHTDSKYICSVCNLKFNTRNLLLRHLRTVHNATELGYRCNECKGEHQIFQGRGSIQRHIASAHPMHPVLQKETESGPKLDYNDENEIKFEEMDVEFLDEFLLNQDENSLCWDEFSLSHFDDFRMPTPDVDHNEHDRYKCPQCVKYFMAQKLLILHLAHDHNELVLICHTCGLRFNRSSILKEHCSSHTTKEDLSKAMCKTSNRNIQCSICNKTYKTAPGLKYHMRTHSKIKPFVCPYCKNAFTAGINLNAHIRNVHAQIKPNLCTLCDRKFASLDHLKKHVISVHQKERNHLCNVCGKSFSQASHLKQHALIHSGDKPFECTVCGLGFIRKNQLLGHQKRCHSEIFLKEIQK